MTTFDGTTLHLQLLGLAVAFVAGAWTLLRRHAPSLLLAAVLLALVTAPSFFGQLQTASADVPLAMAIALGVAALAAWIRTARPGLLPAATLFLTARGDDEERGRAVRARRVPRRVRGHAARPLARRSPGPAAAWAALVVPWHLWLLAHGVTGTTFELSNLLDPGYLVDNAHRVELVRGAAARPDLARLELEPPAARRARRHRARARAPPAARDVVRRRAGCCSRSAACCSSTGPRPSRSRTTSTTRPTGRSTRS